MSEYQVQTLIILRDNFTFIKDMQQRTIFYKVV